MNSIDQQEVVNNKDKNRFEIKLADEYAYVDYRWRGEVFELMYIFVPPPFRGKGVAENLIKFVLDHVVANNLRIKVYCSWIGGYIRTHPEYHLLLSSQSH